MRSLQVSALSPDLSGTALMDRPEPILERMFSA